MYLSFKNFLHLSLKIVINQEKCGRFVTPHPKQESTRNVGRVGKCGYKRLVQYRVFMWQNMIPTANCITLALLLWLINVSCTGTCSIRVLQYFKFFDSLIDTRKSNSLRDSYHEIS